MKCFACGNLIRSAEAACPHCGYKFTADDSRYCPNSKFGLCQITEILCSKGIRWQTCEVKAKADRECDF